MGIYGSHELGVPRHGVRSAGRRPDTVDTMPEATLHAVADHARISTDTIQSSYEDAAAILEVLPRVSVDDEDIMSTLTRDGVRNLSTRRMTYLPISLRPCAPRANAGLGCTRHNHRPQSWPTARLLKDDHIGI